MFRCTNEDCRQALYIKVGDDVINVVIGQHALWDDNTEIECPVCGHKDTVVNWRKCFEDPLPFTYLEKENVCWCGGEIVQNVTIQTAIRMANSSTIVNESKPGFVCEDCGRPAGKELTPRDIIPTVEEMKKIKGFQDG